MSEALVYAIILSVFLGAIFGILWLIYKRLGDVLSMLYILRGKQVWEQTKHDG